MQADFTRLVEAMVARERDCLTLREFDALVGWLSDADRPDVALLAEATADCPVPEPELRSLGLAWVDSLLFNVHSGDFEPGIAGFRDSPFEDQLRRFRQLNALLHPDRHPEGSDWATSRSQALNAVYRKFRREGPGSFLQAYDRNSGVVSAPKTKTSTDSVRPAGSAPPAQWLTQLRWWLAGRPNLPERIVAGFALSGVGLLLLLLFVGPSDPLQPQQTAGQDDGVTTAPLSAEESRRADQSSTEHEQIQTADEQPIPAPAVAVIEPLESLSAATISANASTSTDGQARQTIPVVTVELATPQKLESGVVLETARSDMVSDSEASAELDIQPSLASLDTERAASDVVARETADTPSTLRPSSLWPNRTLVPALSKSMRDVAAMAYQAHQEAIIENLLAEVQRLEEAQRQLQLQLELEASAAMIAETVEPDETEAVADSERVAQIVEEPQVTPELVEDQTREVTALAAAAVIDDSSSSVREAIEEVATSSPPVASEAPISLLASDSMDSISRPEAQAVAARPSVSQDSMSTGLVPVAAEADVEAAVSGSGQSTVSVSARESSSVASPSVAIAPETSATLDPQTPIEQSGVVASASQRSISNPNELLDEFAASFASGDLDEMFSLVTPDLRDDPAPMLAWLGHSAESLFAPGLSRQLNLKPTGLHRASNALRYLVHYQLTYEQSGSRVRREGAVYVTVESVGSDNWRIASFATP